LRLSPADGQDREQVGELVQALQEVTGLSEDLPYKSPAQPRTGATALELFAPRCMEQNRG
jgi:hypothetical protein